MRTSASPKRKTAEFFMSKFLSQKEADDFFNEMEKKVGARNVNHNALTDNSGIPLIEAYVLYMDWLERKVNEE